MSRARVSDRTAVGIRLRNVLYIYIPVCDPGVGIVRVIMALTQ